MSRTSLPALLGALGRLFLRPGALDAAVFEAALGSDWAPGSLGEALRRLLAAPRAGLEVRYAEHFLHGFHRPTVHLQASAHQAGALLDPGVLRRLAGFYDLAGVEPVAAVHPDHLGALASLLGLLLERLQGAAGPEAEALEAAARDLAEHHLGPLLARVQEGLRPSGPQDPYLAAADALAAALGICSRIFA